MTRFIASLLLLSVVLFSRVQAATEQPAKTPFNVRDFGAVGDGVTKDTAALQKALDACSEAGGGEVVVPLGKYLTGSIDLKSRTTLRLEKEATLVGSPDLADYPIVKARWEGRWIDAHRALVSATKAHYVTVLGPGVIAGDQTIGNGRMRPRRPCVVEMIDCREVRLEGFTATQRGMWTIHPTYCENVVVRNLTIRSTAGNSDGVDIDSCRNVLIEGCDIVSGDDCIAIKSGRGMEGVREGRPTENVLVRDCVFSDTLYACVGIGSETSGGIRNVRIERCKFLHAATHAIYIKSRPGRGAFIEDISFDDLDVAVAPRGLLRINLLYSGKQDAEWVPGDDGIPAAKNFRFSNIRVDCGMLIEATSVSPTKPIDGVSFVNIRGTATQGIALANLRNVELRGIDVRGITGPALTVDNVTGSGLDHAVAPIGRVALWNGVDLSGWKTHLADPAVEPAAVWRASNGVLRLAAATKGYLRTEKTYSNYHLNVEWRWPDGTAGGNSGVLVHVNGPDALWPTSYECQLKDRSAGQIVGLGLDIPAAPLVHERKRAAAFAPSSEKPAGQWNTYDIYCLGNSIEVFVNGIRQNRVEGLPLLPANAPAGAIALQLEGAPIEFRNLWLQPL